MYKYIIVTLLLLSPLALAQTQYQAEQFATTLGAVYVGMSKEALYEVYTPVQQKGYKQIGDEEWIEFSEWMTAESGDTITFYLKGGKVKGWDKE
ncbi:MAG: hypothetical protein ACYSSI_10360 [Planctomycetota bacterium]|jgi:uncharacterized protein YdiU (UPF0061 family)